MVSKEGYLRTQLQTHAFNVDGTAMNQYLPYYQEQVQRWLTAKQRVYFYNAVDGYIGQVERWFFKQPQTMGILRKYDDKIRLHNERVLLFIEHLPKYVPWTKYNDKIICATWHREFAYYEALNQCRNLGIGIYEDKHGEPMPVWQQANTWQVKYFVELFAWKRSKFIEYEDYVFHKRGAILTDTQLHNAMYRLSYVDRMIRESCGALHYNLAFYSDNSLNLSFIDYQLTKDYE